VGSSDGTRRDDPDAEREDPGRDDRGVEQTAASSSVFSSGNAKPASKAAAVQQRGTTSAHHRRASRPRQNLITIRSTTDATPS
jgi:hypothetical protein